MLAGLEGQGNLRVSLLKQIQVDLEMVGPF